MSEIHEAILAVMHEVGYVQKEEKRGVSFSVKTEQAVVSALRPSMLEHGLILIPTAVTDIDWRQNEESSGRKSYISNSVMANFHYELIHVPTGDRVSISVLGSGKSRGDDKAPYMAITGSKKYALLNAFLLETGDDPDYHDYESERRQEGPASRETMRKEHLAPPEKNDGEEPITQEHIDELEEKIQQAEALGISIARVDYDEMNLSQWRKAWSKIVDTIEQKQSEEDDIPF